MNHSLEGVFAKLLRCFMFSIAGLAMTIMTSPEAIAQDSEEEGSRACFLREAGAIDQSLLDLILKRQAAFPNEVREECQSQRDKTVGEVRRDLRRCLRTVRDQQPDIENPVAFCRNSVVPRSVGEEMQACLQENRQARWSEADQKRWAETHQERRDLRFTARSNCQLNTDRIARTRNHVDRVSSIVRQIREIQSANASIVVNDPAN